jgi:beta-glucosidase
MKRFIRQGRDAVPEIAVPDGFVLGAATSAYQIEGAWNVDGKGPSIWDTFTSQPGRTAGSVAGHDGVDHYHRFTEDIRHMRAIGLDSYRFSLSWSRLLPAGTGRVNQAGVDFYDRLIDGMLERGLKPFGTIYHWDLPSALMDRGGWMNRDIAGWFADYAALIGEKFGDRLHATATINEPWCVAFLSHYLGTHAPGYRDMRAAARAMHHVLLAHGTAVAALRAEGTKNIGIVTNLQKVEPASDKEADIAAAHAFDGVFNRWYLDGLYKGRYPEDILKRFESHVPSGYEADMATVSTPLDWVGINYYSRSLMTGDPNAPGGIGTVDGPGEKNDLGWEIYPQGLSDLLVRVSREYTKLPIYVTENGMSEDDDARRTEYYDMHLKALRDAKEQGADVRGYFAWSLLDNYEWAEGYTSRFGIVHVDYETQARTPKGSYRAFQGMLHNTR